MADPLALDVDVLVVGAGVSGAAVARGLHRRGNSVGVLESRGRVGGRLHSFESAHGGRLDLGASWFWPGERHVIDLTQELSIRTHPQSIDGDALYHVPSDRPGGAFGAQRLDGNPIDVTSGRFSDGADAIVRGLLAELPNDAVMLGRVVERVRMLSGGRLEARAGDLLVVADHVVLALPPALAVHRIAFDPSLPDDLARVAANTPVWMGAIAKVVITFDQPFWRERGLSGSAISHLGPMRELHDMSGPGGSPAALFGFVPLAPGRPVPSGRELLEQIDALFGVDRPAHTELVVEAWRDQPDTSPPGVERIVDHSNFGHPVYREPTFGGRLHWCSTETATTAPGHIEGALQAAERTVDTIAATVFRTPTRFPDAVESRPT